MEILGRVIASTTATVAVVNYSLLVTCSSNAKVSDSFQDVFLGSAQDG